MAAQPVGRSTISQYQTEMTSVQSQQPVQGQQYGQSEIGQPQPAYGAAYGNPVQNALAVPGNTAGCTPSQKIANYIPAVLSMAFGGILEGIGHQAFEGHRPFNDGENHTRTGECMESFGGALMGIGLTWFIATLLWPRKDVIPNNAIQDQQQQA